MSNISDEQTVEILNTLVQVHNDRIEGYETATNEVEDTDLKTLFCKFMETSIKCKADLITHIRKLGGMPVEGTKLAFKFFKVWMEVKAAFSGNDRKMILDSCEYGEDMAVGVYKQVITDNLENFTEDQKIMLKAQHLLIKSDHDTVKNLRDALLEANL